MGAIRRVSLGLAARAVACLPRVRLGLVFNIAIFGLLFFFLGYLVDGIFYRIFRLKIFTTYLVCEVYFMVYYRWKRRAIQAFVDIKVVSPQKRKELMREWLAAMSEFGKPLLTGWFFNCPLSQIKRGNVREFLTWALFNTTPARLTPSESREIRSNVAGIESAIGHKFPEGYNVGTKCMRNSLDHVKTAYRPLVFYLGVWAQNVASYAVVRSMGYERRHAGKTRYWFRPGRDDSGSQPVVFLHGIGVGISQNLPLLRSIDQDREVYLVELPWVCLRLGETVPSPDQFVRTLEFMLSSHGRLQTGACFIGHSYGTCVVAWMLRIRPKLVKSIILIEPVSIMLYCHQVCFNFLYNSNNKLWGRTAMWLAGKETSVAHALTRHFWWQHNTLLQCDFPKYSSIFLSSHDFICPSETIRKWLSLNPACNEYKGPKKPPKNGAKILVDWLERMDHGYALIWRNCHKRVRQRLFELDRLVAQDAKRHEARAEAK